MFWRKTLKTAILDRFELALFDHEFVPDTCLLNSIPFPWSGKPDILQVVWVRKRGHL
jgi:hypothetical protein